MHQLENNLDETCLKFRETEKREEEATRRERETRAEAERLALILSDN